MYLAVDIGGTKTAIAVLDSNGTIQERIKFPTPRDYKLFIRKFTDCVADLSTKEFGAIGVAVPGRLDRKRGIGLAMGNLPWRNVPIQKDISHITHAPVVIENDAKLAALSEAMLLKTHNKVVYVTISTGIGVGVVFDRKLDPVLIDCEPGHMLLEHNGKLEIWEDFASGRAIVERYGKLANEITDKKTWKEIAHKIALGMIDLIAVIQPDIIVLGGSVGTHFEKYKEYLTKELRSYETPMVPVPPIIEAQRPEEAVIYGCYEFAKSLHGKTHS